MILAIRERLADAEVDGVQALTELANIVGGELILAMGAATERFDLGLPEEMEGPPETLRPAIQATSACKHADS